MKLIYFTDIHGSFNVVAQLLNITDATVYIISGDLIDIPFYNIDTAINYHELQTEINGLRKKLHMEDLIIEDFVDELMNIPDIPDSILDKGEKYHHYTIRARRVMQQKYKILEHIISYQHNPHIYVIAGNYDMDLKFTALHERDLHLKWHMVNGIKFAGYGGADVWTTGIPEKYIISYNAGIGVNDTQNELYTFFKAIKPDIIVTHQPAHGILDRISYRGPSGSPALRTYVDNNDVLLTMSGHIHMDWGLKYVNDTIFINPSNFGEVTTVKGEVSEGGFYFEIEIDELHRKIETVKFKKIAQNELYTIASYKYYNNNWNERIVDTNRYYARKRDINYDLREEKHSHIPEVELFEDIKKYIEMFRSPDSDEIFMRIEKAAELMKDNFSEIALDLFDSFQIKRTTPSLDIIIYLKTIEKDQLNDIDSTNQYIKEIIKNLIGDILHYDIVDWIPLNIVEQSIISRNYECEFTQRFIAYRSICTPINYSVIEPVESLIDKDMEFKKEVEGSIRTYLKILIETSLHIDSYRQYQSNLDHIGIKIPDYIRKKIKTILENSIS